MATTAKSPFYTDKEIRDFRKLCQIHGFKNRKYVKDNTTDNIIGFNIILPQISGSQEKLLSNVARYTNSRKIIEPYLLPKGKMAVKVSLTRK